METQDEIMGARPPIVAIVGHIDHGKSTLLDYIRTNHIVDGRLPAGRQEAGGITQHLSAYEAVHENSTGKHKITFLDTPGHEAFTAMRSRGLEVADVAILVVSAEEGAKTQTLEALKLIDEVKIPYIVAFTKIDKPGANLEKAKMSLLENNVFLEGMGGEVPWVAVSGKSGEGVPELLDLILLAGEIEGLSADKNLPGEGLVIEGHVDNKRGNTATLIVQNGSIRSGEYVVAGEALAPVRIMENFLGKKIKEGGPSSPVTIVGFSSLPAAGTPWRTVESKKEAEEEVALARKEFRKFNLPPQVKLAEQTEDEERVHVILPLVIKTDVAGMGEAVMHELDKLIKQRALPTGRQGLEVRVVLKGVGPISEGDVRLAGAGSVPGIIAGFNVKVEREARDLAERLGVEIAVFDIIYKLAEWLGAELEKRQPREKAEQKTGSAKIIKIFSYEKGRAVLGGRVDEGTLTQGQTVKVMRHDIEIARGTVVSLQSQKLAVKKVESGSEFGAMIKLGSEPAAGDYIEAFEEVMK
jgi:translation initiation factor IF-2